MSETFTKILKFQFVRNVFECLSFRLKYFYQILKIIIPLAFLFTVSVRAQVPVRIDDQQPHHIFSFAEVGVLEDAHGNLNIDKVSSAAYQHQFKANKNYVPKNYNTASVYWYRFRIEHDKESGKKWMLEFFDQSINDLSLFVPDDYGSYHAHYFGTNYAFAKREYQHKNFTYDLSNKTDHVLTYYVRLKSPHSISAIIVLRDLKWFVGYALNEYFLFGLFYGMIIVFSLYNLLMYFAIKEKKYLFYVLYNLSIGLYEMCSDGIAFQYLWPNYPGMNTYGFGIALFASSLFGLLFTINFLYLKYKAPQFYRFLLTIIVLRSLFFITCLFYTSLFNLKVVEFIPLLAVFSASVYVMRQHYQPATFLVAGYGFLVGGFIVKILLLLKWIPYGPFSYYSLSFCFLVEMILVSFAIGNSIRTLRKKKDRAQKRTIKQLRINQELNQTLNAELTVLVDERTKELQHNALIIEKQNEEISIMNAMLKKDNTELHLNIEKVTRARVMSKLVDFEEFSKVYPDKESGFKYIAELKWAKGYTCRKCDNNHWLAGQTIHSRRCTKCGYDESVIANTLFQNSKIPINKALYMLFLVYSTKGTISSHKLSQILMIRQSTCWTYNSKMQKLLQERKEEVKNAGEEGWAKLVLENPSVLENT